MSIPLDRLYNHIDQLSQAICEDRLIIYQFYPHGSKNLENLTALSPMDSIKWFEMYTAPMLICHDQEPLNYDLYSDETVKTYATEKYANLFRSHYHVDIASKMHLRVAVDQPINCYDAIMLTHSEKNSIELTKYEKNDFVGVYWWSHAAIARDWFRYAEHVKQSKQVSKTFLIYNRAWAGTREYRLKFVEFLITQQLQSVCQARLNVVEPETGVPYTRHRFQNTIWKPKCALEGHFDSCTAGSHSSADFELIDYETTDIEVVLETLFDDQRWHLTEKTLRPIALGQPFILAATPGSLKYLQSYGFKTFDTVWSELYDQITSPMDRLEAIAHLMKSIVAWDTDTRRQKMALAQEIANYNKNLFFSKNWQDSIFLEYQQNFKLAWEQLKTQRTGKHVLNLRSHAATDPDWANTLNSDLPHRTKEDVQRVAEWIKQVNQ
jgi:hypothetical protein